MKASAAERTFPLFEGETPQPKKVSRLALIFRARSKLTKAAMAWFRDEVGYEEVLLAARELHELYVLK